MTKETVMKKFIIALIWILFSATLVFAGGDQNNGSTGSGTTNTGSTAQGSADQARTGR